MGMIAYTVGGLQQKRYFLAVDFLSKNTDMMEAVQDHCSTVVGTVCLQLWTALRARAVQKL